MSEDTSLRLGLPFVAAGQMQKHVTVNQALTRLDTLVQMTIESRVVSAQPPDPPDGWLYLLPPGASGADWGTRPSASLMQADGGAWLPVEVPRGQLAWLVDEELLILFDGSQWITAPGSSGGGSGGIGDSVAAFGIGTAASPANPLSVRANTALLTARPVAEGGDGDFRLGLNRDQPGDTVSVVFQSGYSGRAEIGLAGSEGLSVKVSPDGANWMAALSIDPATGLVVAAGPPLAPLGLATRAFVESALQPHADELTVLVASGSYPVPAWARRLVITAIGGGGGGGAGAAGDATANRFGGGGGAAGGICEISVTGAGAVLTVQVGDGGAGGAAVSGTAVGNPGLAGGESRVSDGGVELLIAPGGTGGSGGLTNAGAGGTGVACTAGLSNAGGSAQTGISVPGQSDLQARGGGGGGAGGTLTTGGVQRLGSAGGNGFQIGGNGRRANGGSGGAIGAAGSAGSDPLHPQGCGAGGGGGGASSSAAGGAGAAGGLVGGGGGGGGASRGVQPSGAGGTGARGEVRILALA